MSEQEQGKGENRDGQENGGAKISGFREQFLQEIQEASLSVCLEGVQARQAE